MERDIDGRTVQDYRREMSDLHKDVYGFRPSMEEYGRIAAMADDEIKAEWWRLCGMLTDD